MHSRINQMDENSTDPWGTNGSEVQMQSLILNICWCSMYHQNQFYQEVLELFQIANMERLFDTPTLRNFEFSWKMTPRDEEEAKQVKAIIRFFKQGMAAKTLNNVAGDRALFLGTPNIFRLQYRTAMEEKSLRV